MTSFAIAGIQIDAASGDNLGLIARQVAVARARFPWIDMILIGELCAYGPRVQAAQAMPGPAEHYLRALARRHRVWLLPGSLYEVYQGEVYNTAPVIDPEGEVIGRYRKMYPFLPYESGVSAGHEPLVFDVPGVGRFGVSICYDKWFPETTRALCWQGAEVILHPTLTNTIDREAELTLARAAALTNQCYFFDINTCGELGYGRSIIVGPEGEVLHEAGERQQIMPVMVDMEYVRRVRREGFRGLGQPLKSFRDAAMHFDAYQTGASSAALDGLGPLRMPPARNAAPVGPQAPNDDPGAA